MSSAPMFCTKCGTLGYPERIVKSNFFVEILVWIVALVFAGFVAWPAVLIAIAFTMWRAFGAYRGCPKCKEPGMIPENTPVAQQVMKDLEARRQATK